MFFQVGSHRSTFSLTWHHCLRELFSTVIGIETFWQRSKTSIAIWHSIFFLNSIPKQMVSIQLAKAKPEYCGKIGLSFPLHNFISKNKIGQVWVQGVFLTLATSLWLWFCDVWELIWLLGLSGSSHCFNSICGTVKIFIHE